MQEMLQAPKPPYWTQNAAHCAREPGISYFLKLLEVLHLNHLPHMALSELVHTSLLTHSEKSNLKCLVYNFQGAPSCTHELLPFRLPFFKLLSYALA